MKMRSVSLQWNLWKQRKNRFDNFTIKNRIIMQKKSKFVFNFRTKCEKWRLNAITTLTNQFESNNQLGLKTIDKSNCLQQSRVLFTLRDGPNELESDICCALIKLRKMIRSRRVSNPSQITFPQLNCLLSKSQMKSAWVWNVRLWCIARFAGVVNFAMFANRIFVTLKIVHFYWWRSCLHLNVLSLRPASCGKALNYWECFKSAFHWM